MLKPLTLVSIALLPCCAVAHGGYRSGGGSMTPPAPATGGTFVHAGVNPVVATREDRFSTFAIDVDTASWMYARRFLASGERPDAGAVRVEEFVNAMHYDYAAPSGDDAFAIHVAGAPSPFVQKREVVRVALQAKRVSKEERKPATLTFLVDVSGSMGEPDKLPWVQQGLHMAVDALRPDDRVAIVTYAGSTGVVLEATPARDAKKIHAAIDHLSSGGGTFMSSGMDLAYREAARELDRGEGSRLSRVFVMSDGDANIGNTDAKSILASIKAYVAKGVTMSTMGFGTGNYNDALMEELADAGDGNYTYIGDEDAMKRFFVDDMTNNLVVVAADTKIQVEWNPETVASYRLLGYENRDIADEDFQNDKKDAGEVGAGHAVTALYEIERVPGAAARADLGVVRVRHKVPGHAEATEAALPIRASDVQADVEGLDADAQAALGMALGAEILRGSDHAAGLTLTDAALLLKRSARGPHADERRAAADLFMRAATSLPAATPVAAR